MAVRIDKSGRHRQAARIDHAVSPIDRLSDLHDFSVLDGDIRTIVRTPRTVNDFPVFDYQIIHRDSSVFTVYPHYNTPLKNVKKQRRFLT